MFYERLDDFFIIGLLEPALFFQRNSFQFFTHSNQLLQRDEPTIHIFKALMERLANGVIKSETLRSIKSITDLALNDQNIFIYLKNTYFGLQTNAKLKALLNKGDISEYQSKNFMKQHISTIDLPLIFNKFPISDEIIVEMVHG